MLLGIVTIEGPHLLILDEPTNHLDIDSRAALADALNTYPGAVMIVSHDRHLIEATVDRLWLVKGGTVSAYDGDLADYTKMTLSEKSGARPQNAKGQDKSESGPRIDLKALRKKLAEAEAKMQKIQAEIEKSGPHPRPARLFSRPIPAMRPWRLPIAPTRWRNWPRQRKNGLWPQRHLKKPAQTPDLQAFFSQRPASFCCQY